MTSDPSPESLAIPPGLLAEIQAEAERDHRPAGDVLREVIERGLGALRWAAHSEAETWRARELGIPEADDDQPMTDAYREAIREKIAQGLASARQGKLVDGPAIFARIRAENDMTF
jgi:hypothetical protein